jgi:hypothetical protein
LVTAPNNPRATDCNVTVDSFTQKPDAFDSRTETSARKIEPSAEFKTLIELDSVSAADESAREANLAVEIATSWAMLVAYPFTATPKMLRVRSNKGVLTSMKSTGAEPLERRNFSHCLLENTFQRRASYSPHQNHKPCGHQGNENPPRHVT